MNDPTKTPSENVSLNYYMAGLEEAIEQKNTPSALYFVKKILEIHGSRINVNIFTTYVIVFFVILNFLIAVSNTYVLLLK